MNNRQLILAATIAMVCVTGCATTSQKTARQEAQDNWTNARASVAEGLARDQFKTGNLRQARATIDQVLALSDVRASSHLLSAQIAIEEGKLEAAHKSLERAAKLDKSDPEIDYYRGIVSQRWRRGEEALAYYRAAATKKPDDLAYVTAQAEMLVQLDRINDAISLLEDRVVFFESSSAIRDTLAQILERRDQPGDRARAIDLYRQAVVLSSDDNSVRERWAIALYRASEFEQAKVVLCRLLQADEYRRRTDLLLALANSQLNTDMPSDARTTFDQIIDLDARLAGAHVGVAKASLMLEDFARARIALMRAASLSSGSVEVALLQSTLAIKQSRWGEAEQALSRVLMLEPNNATALALNALAKSRLGKAGEARTSIAKATAVDPADQWVRSIQAQIR